MTVQLSTAVRNARADAWQHGAITAQNSATAWAISTGYTALDSRVTTAAGVYLCTTSGTSASSGTGPTGTGGSISDGSCAWTFVGPLVWAQSTAYLADQFLVNGGNVYMCKTAGTSAGSGTGPASTGSGVGSDITDGTAHWIFVGEGGIGPSAIMNVYTGAQPASCAASETGTLLVQFILNVDYAGLASSGVKSLLALPIAATASAGGTAAHYRIYDSAGAVCHEQGTMTNTGGGGDATIDNVSITSSQTVSLTSFSSTEASA